MRGMMWFGARGGRMRWVPAPKSPADASSAGWGTSDTYLNGGAFVRHSWGSHKQFVYEWPESSSMEAAAIMASYRDGTYGRGLLDFIDPLTYERNVLPARWADPSMTMDLEGSSLVAGVEPTAVPSSGGATNDLPVVAAYYDLAPTPVGYRGDSDSVYIAIPEGFTLRLGAFYASTGSGGVFAAPVSSGGVGTPVKLTALANNSSVAVQNAFSGVDGVRVWVGKSAVGAATVTVNGLVARLTETGKTPKTSGPWSRGLGHSGCRFVGEPTLVEYNAVDGGQVGYAATFKEVGDWL